MDIYVDVGNTHTVFGVIESFSYPSIKESIEKGLQELRFSTKHIDTAEDIYSSLFPFVQPQKEGKFVIDSFVVSSVVPQVNFAIERFIEKYTICENIFWVEAREDLGIDWQTEDYKQMGADRVADILGAICLFKDNFCIADFGTAITLDVVVNKKYVGGSISPGFLLLIKSLFQETAKLPMVEIKPLNKILDNTTVGQIQLGTVDIISKGINSIISEIKKSYNVEKVILTGGFSKIVRNIIVHDEIVDKLQFIGMKYYSEMLKEKNKVK
ncbi:MAG: type III pantothenate kinase [bacterium]